MPVACPRLAVVLFCWLSVSSLWIYPHSLSYFNESIGGPRFGPSHLLGSNVDWGQDLRYVIWASGEGNAAKIVANVDYYDPNLVGLRCQWVSTYQRRTTALERAADSNPDAAVILSVNRQQEYPRSQEGMHTLNYTYRVAGPRSTEPRPRVN